MSTTGAELDERTLGEILGRVHRFTGITMGGHKKMLLQGRLSKRLRELSIGSYAEYLNFLDSTPSEKQPFINLVTTNETHFFRTPTIWDYFEKEFLEEFSKNAPGKKARIWSAASSSGEEAYSIAILGREFQARHAGFQFEVFGSDISTAVLAEAEKATYGGRSMEDLKTRFPDRVTKFFSPVDPESYRLKPEIRSLVRFGTQSLFDPPRLKEAYDIVFLRNVMIYFNDADLQIVLKNVADTLVPGGILVVGESESLSRFKTEFEFVRPLIYRKSAGGSG